MSISATLGPCPDFEDLSCFIDDELDSTMAQSVREHLDSCERCSSLSGRLQHDFHGSYPAIDGGMSGSGCADEEGLILYLTQDLSDRERKAVETHLSRCDSCVYGLSLLRKRLRIEDMVDQPVPTALQGRVRDLIEHGARDLAKAEPEAASWMHRVREALDRSLRLPVLVPAAVAAGALLAVGVQNQQLNEHSGVRAIERVSEMRVTVNRVFVREVPRPNAGVLGEFQRGDLVRVAGEDRDWYRVMLSPEQSGWVEREAFE